MRADWRFLLPWDEERAPLIRVSDSRRASWMEEDGWAVAEGPADAVAVEQGPELDRILGGTTPSRLIIWCGRPSRRGWLRRLRAGRGGVIDERLAGHHISTYLPLPLRGTPRTYLPLDAAARPVLQAWISDRLPRPLRWSAATVVGAALGLGRRLPGVVVVAVAAEVASAPVVLVTTSGHDEGSRAVRISHRFGVAGVAGDADDSYVATSTVEKFANRPRYAANNEGEQEALASVRSRLPASLAAAVPQPLGIDTKAGALRVSETYLAGPTMSQLLSARSSKAEAEGALDRALGWFEELHQATAEPFIWSADHTEQLLSAPLEALPPEVLPPEVLPPEVLPSAGDPAAGFRSLIDVVGAQAEGGRAAHVLRHYDPGPWNLVMGDHLGVIDWEHRPPRPADRMGLALCDQLYLVAYWRHVVVGSRSSAEERAVSGLGSPSTSRQRWAVETGQARLDAAADALEIDQRVMPALWVHNWLEQALFTHLRRPDGQPGSGVEYLSWAGADGSALLRFWAAS